MVRIFKKKKKIPNLEYPVCNLDSRVADFGKCHFCLVEIENEEENSEIEKHNINKNIEINKGKEKQDKNDDIVKTDRIIENNSKNNQNKITSDNNNNGENVKNNEKGNKQSCWNCLMF